MMKYGYNIIIISKNLDAQIHLIVITQQAHPVLNVSQFHETPPKYHCLVLSAFRENQVWPGVGN